EPRSMEKRISRRRSASSRSAASTSPALRNASAMRRREFPCSANRLERRRQSSALRRTTSTPPLERIGSPLDKTGLCFGPGVPRRRRRVAKALVSPARRDPAPRPPHEEPVLDQERLVDLLDRARVLADRDGES